VGGKKEQTNSDVNLTHSSFAFTMQKIKAAGSFGDADFIPYFSSTFILTVTSLWNFTLSQPFLQRVRMANLTSSIAIFILSYLLKYDVNFS